MAKKTTRSVAAANRKMAFNKAEEKATGARSAKKADAAGPKAGSSRSNQSAKYSATETRKQFAEAQKIRLLAAKVPAGKAYNDLLASLSDYAAGGLESVDTLRARVANFIASSTPQPKGERSVGHMARGISSSDAPHSSAALQDNRAAARKAGKPAAEPKATGKTAKVAAKKAVKTTGTDDRKVTIVDKKFTFGAPGTARRAAWDAMAGAKTVADYLAAGGKAKYLGRWQAAGAIKLG